MRRKIISIASAVFVGFISWAVPKYLEVNNVITQENSYWLLYAIYIGIFIIVCILIWGFWPNVKQIFSNVRRLRLTLKPEQEHKNVGTRFVRKVSEEERELLDFYEHQKANWKSNIRLRIVRVMPAIDGDVPKVVFELEMINFLPIECRLIKVTHSSGTVSAGVLGSCALPSLPETIDEKINACSEKQFTIEMQVSGTKIPDFLHPKLTEWGQLLQWTLKGEWYVELEGKIEVWQYQAYEVSYDQVIVRQ